MEEWERVGGGRDNSMFKQSAVLTLVPRMICATKVADWN